MTIYSHHCTHKAIRLRLIAVAILVCAVSAVTAAEPEVVTIRFTPDPKIEAHIRQIQGPERIVQVSIDKAQSAASKSQDVSVRGPIADSMVSSLANSALAGKQGYWTTDYSWRITIIADDKYANVVVSNYCGELCAGGARYTYVFKDGKWSHEYTSAQWVS